jgi:large subunit ribosomal protein LP1
MPIMHLHLAHTAFITQADKITALTSAASVDVEPIWATLLAKALEGKNVKDLLSNVGAGGAAAPAVGGVPAATAGGAAAEEAPKEEKAKEEEKEESDDDMVRRHVFYL